MPGPKGKVLLAMSGGVDSSVAAALLRDDGFEVVGCFMRLGSPGDDIETGVDASRIRLGHQGCCSVGDARDAELVAAHLDIPFYVLNFKRDFGRVIDYFVDEYNAGRTPNPCVRCNDWLKFGRLADYARSIDAQWVASGHHARVERVDGEPALLRAVDLSKDQSYVLFGVSRTDLGRTLLPVGRYPKGEIRRIARELDLPVHDKADSQEICFVPDMDYAGLVRRRTPEQVHAGAVRDTAGRVLGEHPGHQHYTVGQRRGIGVALGYPLYVVEKDATTNTITVGDRAEIESIGCQAGQVNWLVDPPLGPRHCQVQIRYNAAPVAGTIAPAGSDGLEVRFEQAQIAVAPGQAVVCYDGERVLGGAWIRQAIRRDHAPAIESGSGSLERTELDLEPRIG